MQSCHFADVVCAVGVGVSYILIMLPTGTAEMPPSQLPARPLMRPWLLGLLASLLFWVTRGTSRCAALILFILGIVLQGYALTRHLDTKIARAIRVRPWLQGICALRWVSLWAALGAALSSVYFLCRWR